MNTHGCPKYIKQNAYLLCASVTVKCIYGSSRCGSIRILIQAFDDIDLVNALTQQFVIHITQVTIDAECIRQLDFVSLGYDYLRSAKRAQVVYPRDYTILCVVVVLKECKMAKHIKLQSFER